jgi:hypothetical protein
VVVEDEDVEPDRERLPGGGRAGVPLEPQLAAVPVDRAPEREVDPGELLLRGGQERSISSIPAASTPGST